jgi:sugar phosphate isomerase/epimerase
VPLPDGDIDYRFAIAAMLDSGYAGYLAVEGAREGDALSKDRRGIEYVRQLLAELARESINGEWGAARRGISKGAASPV